MGVKENNDKPINLLEVQPEIPGNSFVGIDRLFPDFPDIKWD
jgi:hypothetical protein